MYQRILIPLDGSPIAEQVLPLVKMLVVRFQSSVLLFQAIQPITKGVPVEGAALHAEDQVDLLRKKALEYLADEVPGENSAGRREKAIAAFACMIGGLILARAVNDEEFSDLILKTATRGSIALASRRRRRPKRLES